MLFTSTKIGILCCCRWSEPASDAFCKVLNGTFVVGAAAVGVAVIAVILVIAFVVGAGGGTKLGKNSGGSGSGGDVCCALLQ